MKNTAIIQAMFLSVMCTCACARIDTEVTDDTPKYYGTMTVQSDGAGHVSENVAVQVALSEDGSTLDIKLNKVKFVPSMPVRIDVTIPKVPVVSAVSSAEFEFAGDGIVPYALGNRPYEKYRVTELEGRAGGGRIEFTLNFGEYPTSYEGVMDDGGNGG